MKLAITIGSVATVLAPGLARADFIFNVNQNIPQGNLAGLASVGNVSGLLGAGTITSLSLGLNVSGGYNGDLYAYLEAPNGSTVTLLNNPGVTDSDPFGYGGSGFNITLTDAATASLQNTPETDGVALTGTYQPVGSFSTLSGGGGNGNWTLFFADNSEGGGQSVLNSWSLDISTTSAPEPGQLAGMFLIGLLGAARWIKPRRT